MVKTRRNAPTTTVRRETKIIDGVKLGMPVDFSFMSLKTLHSKNEARLGVIELKN